MLLYSTICTTPCPCPCPCTCKRRVRLCNRSHHAWCFDALSVCGRERHLVDLGAAWQAVTSGWCERRDELMPGEEAVIGYLHAQPRHEPSQLPKATALSLKHGRGHFGHESLNAAAGKELHRPRESAALVALDLRAEREASWGQGLRILGLGRALAVST